MYLFQPLIEAIQPRIQYPALIVMGSAHQALEFVEFLSHSAPEGGLSCYQMDLHHGTKLSTLLKEKNLSAKIELHPDLWDVPAQYRTVLLPISAHGERELKLDLIEQAYHVLVAGGLLIALSEYQADQLLPKAMKKVFGKCSQLPSSHKGSVFWAHRPHEARPRRRHEQKFHARLGQGPSHEFLSRPGTFSYGEFDNGSRALIDSAEIRTGDRILDLGCGNGAVGILAADLAGPEGEIVFVDSNLRAIQLTELNAKSNGLSRFRTVATSEFSHLEPHSFDVILANPPYFANSWVAQLFIEKSAPLLKPGGRFYLVTKMLNHVVPMMVQTFGEEIVVIEHRGYNILSAGLPSESSKE
ncbi:MAG: class I SAM-dependent methyltransferase [Gemmataceae bacterium]|jgi:16S rRNA (guanine1207-N2)-methyltransferase|nr:class I SAM-dependent methyltransferase [Gemmataceae bacterium]